jgi:hypothetical protein
MIGIWISHEIKFNYAKKYSVIKFLYSNYLILVFLFPLGLEGDESRFGI